MRTFVSVLLATSLGLATLAFAASPPDAGTREERMASALSDYRQAQGVISVQPNDAAQPLAVRHRPKKHDKKHQPK